MEATLFNIQKFCLHDGPGIRTTVFFKGCNLRCAWCANPESQAMAPEEMGGKPVGRAYTLEEVLEETCKDKPFYDQSGGGVTLSGGEPLMQADFACALCDALHAQGVSVGIETAALADTGAFERVLGKLDFAQIDLKHWDEEKHRLGTGVGNAQILNNLRLALASSLPVIVRIPVIPGFNDSPADARAFGDLLAGLGAREVQLMPFHQLGELKYSDLGRPYAYGGVPQLHEEGLSAFAGALTEAGLKAQIGG